MNQTNRRKPRGTGILPVNSATRQRTIPSTTRYHRGSAICHGQDGRATLRRSHAAFTLVELLLVLTILGILAALVVPKMVGRSEQARQTAAQTDISTFGTALDAFEVDNGYYPKGKSGMADLIAQPRDCPNWHGPYVKEIPKDPWGNEYVYECPGRHNPKSYDLYSVGPDGRPGTDDDVTNWSGRK
jgi:general secretion pathway protein G